MKTRSVLRQLVLPYEAMRTLYEGNCEVRLYRNNITGVEQVGKRIDLLGLDETVAAREGKLLQTVRHPNLVPVLDVVEVDDPAFPPPLHLIELVMPFFPRGSVYDAQDRGEWFSVGAARDMVQAALRGLGELHERHHILHRDVKSSNVLLADDGTVLKVGDLGVAVPMDDDGLAEAHPSPQLYSPPETFVGGRIGRFSDLYAVGLLLVELCNGPFPKDYTRDECIRRLERGKRSLRNRDVAPGPWVPRGLRRVIRKAIAVDTAQRYQRAHDMSEDLARVRLVDWSMTVHDAAHTSWEGVSSAYPDRQFSIAAVMKRGAWVLTASKHVTRWQRFHGPVVVPSVTHGSSFDFFDQVVTAATTR